MNLTILKLKLSMALLSLVTIALAAALALAVATYFFGVSIGPFVITGILILVFILNIVQWLFGPYMINAMYRAHEVTPDDPNYGWLVNLVSEVASYNNMSPPKVYIANVNFPNAFAYGSPIAGKRVAITLPLLRILKPEEIKAVLGHELGHLKHHDVELLMAIGLLPAVIYWLGYSLFWGGMFGGGGGRNNSGGYMFLVGIALLVVSFLFNFLVLGINRMREAYADAHSAMTVPGGAENLQTALAKLELSMNQRSAIAAKKQNSMMKMLYFASPVPEEDQFEYDARELIEKWRNMKVHWYDDILSDHPHSAKRIKLLDRLKYGE
ncbi:heat-shock protein HtpX [Sulfolobales archaeon HS-7]|nr:heat-shock protein HtpX [Sulfolobales archaeon HS-7]